jgi:hypothetical protein
MALARHQFPPAIVQHAVRLYVRCTLSYRDVEDLLVELPLQEQLGENSRTRKGEISELDERLTPNESQPDLPWRPVETRRYDLGGSCQARRRRMRAQLPGRPRGPAAAFH